MHACVHTRTFTRADDTKGWRQRQEAMMPKPLIHVLWALILPPYLHARTHYTCNILYIQQREMARYTCMPDTFSSIVYGTYIQQRDMARNTYMSDTSFYLAYRTYIQQRIMARNICMSDTSSSFAYGTYIQQRVMARKICMSDTSSSLDYGTKYSTELWRVIHAC